MKRKKKDYKEEESLVRRWKKEEKESDNFKQAKTIGSGWKEQRTLENDSKIRND